MFNSSSSTNGRPGFPFGFLGGAGGRFPKARRGRVGVFLLLCHSSSSSSWHRKQQSHQAGAFLGGVLNTKFRWAAKWGAPPPQGARTCARGATPPPPPLTSTAARPLSRRRNAGARSVAAPRARLPASASAARAATTTRRRRGAGAWSAAGCRRAAALAARRATYTWCVSPRRMRASRPCGSAPRARARTGARPSCGATARRGRHRAPARAADGERGGGDGARGLRQGRASSVERRERASRRAIRHRRPRRRRKGAAWRCDGDDDARECSQTSGQRCGVPGLFSFFSRCGVRPPHGGVECAPTIVTRMYHLRTAHSRPVSYPTLSRHADGYAPTHTERV